MEKISNGLCPAIQASVDDDNNNVSWSTRRYTIELNSFGVYSLRAHAKIVEVFPVPGGPYRRRWGRWSASMKRSTEK